MIISLNWLKNYTDIDINADEFCRRMIMSGSNLETCTHFGENIKNVVVGKVVRIEKHPDADKLLVCQTDIGDATAKGKENGLLQIVTGAPNVFEGAVLPVALHGSYIPSAIHGKDDDGNGTKITRSKLRGIISNGMFCGPQELGIEDKCAPLYCNDGLWILNDYIEKGLDIKLGEDIVKALNLDDYIIDFEITPNRPDCLSVIGIAREASATLDKPLNYPATGVNGEGDKMSIAVENYAKGCKRYVARTITDIKIEQSPLWMQNALMASGMRPINNIVDIANYVMLETGQPLHTFDTRFIENGKIVVRECETDIKFTTLDGETRNVSKGTTMICDGKKEIGIAGIMGGQNSEVKPDTTEILLESANFEKGFIKKASKQLSLKTEASTKYEKGVDINLASFASDRFCHLVEELGCGRVSEDYIDLYSKDKTAEVPLTVRARVSRINSFLGIDISREEMEGYLRRLEMKV